MIFFLIIDFVLTDMELDINKIQDLDPDFIHEIFRELRNLNSFQSPNLFPFHSSELKILKEKDLKQFVFEFQANSQHYPELSRYVVDAWDFHKEKWAKVKASIPFLNLGLLKDSKSHEAQCN